MGHTIQFRLTADTLDALRSFAEETGAMCHEWKDTEGTPSLSLIDMQNYKKEYHVQSYHLLGTSGLVLRTQSIFELT